MNVHFSSKTEEWATPQDFFDELNREFKFTLDPCATKENAKCVKYFTKEDDGLAQSWKGETVFMNPPYGREIGKWVKKAAEGGGNSGRTTSRPHRYQILSRVYLRKSRDPFYQRSLKVWGE